MTHLPRQRGLRSLAGPVLVAMAAALSAARVAPQYTVYGQGCPGSGGVPVLTASGVPAPGQSFSVDLVGGRAQAPAALLFGASRTSFQGLPLPFVLTGYGAPGCSLLASAEAWLGQPTSPAGTASVAIAVPADAGLSGTVFFNQWLVVDPANSLGVVVSNGGEGAILEPPVSITAITPTTLNATTVLQVTGRHLGSGSESDDLRVYIGLASGDRALCRVDAIQNQSGGVDVASVRIATLPELPGVGTLQLARGDGARVVVGATARLGTPAETWVWQGDSLTPNRASSPLPLTLLQGGAGPKTTYNRFAAQGASLFVDLPPNPCTLPAGYPAGTALTADLHFDVQRQGEPFQRHHHVLLRDVAVQSGASCAQVAADHAAQLQAALDARHGPGRFAVSADTTGGRCRIVLTSLDPTRAILGGGGKLVVTCP